MINAGGVNFDESIQKGWSGLTKREMFAMNAPKMPNWFVTKELGTRIYQSELGKLEFKWRWYYADMMLQEGEK